MSFLRSRPLTSAVLGSVVVAVGLGVVEWFSSPPLVVQAISAAQVPTVDGDISDPAWQMASPVSVLTRHGSDFGGTGESRIEVRAVQDGHDLYPALQWDDPTRSLEYQPLLKDGGAWHLLRTTGHTADEARFFDDRIAVMLAQPGLAMIGGAIHLGKQPLPDAPASASGRGLHYTAPGRMVDLWIWDATIGKVTSRLQDNFLGPPLGFTSAQMAGDDRYFGGIGIDQNDRPVAAQNFAPVAGDASGAVLPLRLPDPSVAAIGLDDIEPDADLSNPLDEHEDWALRRTDSFDYSPAADDRIADGTVIPGILVDDTVALGPLDPEGHGTWAGGH